MPLSDWSTAKNQNSQNSILEMPVHTYNVAMTCGGCSGAVTRILTKQLIDGEKFDVS